jgi:hypothetical protein
LFWAIFWALAIRGWAKDIRVFCSRFEVMVGF